MKPLQCVLICLFVSCLPGPVFAAPYHKAAKTSAQKPAASVWTPGQNQSATYALKSLRKLYVVTSIGVTCADYQNRVIDVASGVYQLPGFRTNHNLANR
jgi:hypothetical protein